MKSISLKYLARKQFYTLTIITGIILSALCVIHMKIIEDKTITSYFDNISLRLNADREKIYNILYLDQNQILNEIFQDYKNNYKLKSMRMALFGCAHCEKVTDNLYRDKSHADQLVYRLSEDLKPYDSIILIPNYDNVFQRKSYVFIYFLIYLFSLGLISFLNYYHRSLLDKFLIRPLYEFLYVIKTYNAGSNIYGDHSIIFDDAFMVQKSIEQVAIENQFKSLIKRLCDAQEEGNQLRMRALIGDVSIQVAHDIRSPLAALDMAVKQTAELPEENRLLIRSAVQRIRDIANDLSQKKQVANKGAISPVQNEESSVQLLSGLLDSIVSEKRLQYRDRIGIEIESQLDESYYGLFAAIQPVEFKRVLSNLINNAIEALANNGKVEVKLSGGDNISIQISDNGKGIPPEILPKLMQRGETHGKSGGSGLGLYHARTSVEKWGGSVEITSTIDVGTTITVMLPKALSPSWFVAELILPKNGTVIVIDDDDSIHQIWKQRFEEWRSKGQVTLIHFSSPEKFIEWRNCNPANESCLYLCDYEFLNHDKTGIDVIQELKIANKSILVTSHFEEEYVRTECENLGVRLIPKNLAGFVPMTMATESSQESIDAILIDDDDLVHMNWKMAAKHKNKIVRVYTGPEGFWKDSTAFAKDTPIYVDSNLADGVKGEDISWMMGKKGFSNLHLATGYDATQFDDMPWLKGIVGKSPPW